MHYFVRPDSVVRRIWGDADVILLIFAGSAAEFALNKAVDWLFFTGRLPADPIARLFSTVRYAQEIVFAPDDRARQAIGRMHTIHKGVEQNRGYSIPDWAYRDVLYMLIDYSERAYQLLHRPLTDPEREELFTTFRAVGAGMGVPDLPVTYADWQVDRRKHLDNDLLRSDYTDRLFQRYHEQLGTWRYNLLRRVQSILVPEQVRIPLELTPDPILPHSISLYKLLNAFKLRSVVQRILLPTEYLAQIQGLDQPVR
ncbi:oxygenase MpaB family protein [uncultured Spirosoma sp.]|uniref:oxygenase MpaB family protein n=1 Tax=uncultured Spirosoma sp. TaxID=278208 RepID=UPI002589597C|nr:oxygenase MpaB family protein [uncultured Spirosoma sp.]